MAEFYGPLTGWGWLICTPLAVASAVYVGWIVVDGFHLVRDLRKNRET